MFKGKIMKKFLMATAAFFVIAVPLWAQKSDAELEALIMQNSQVGPQTIDLGSEATLQLPAGMTFIKKDAANKLWKPMAMVQILTVTALLWGTKAGLPI